MRTLEKVIGSSIEVILSSDKYQNKPYPADLHGLCYNHAGADFPHEDFRAPVFHPFLDKWKASHAYGVNATLMIQSTSELFTSRILHYLGQQDFIYLGSGKFKVKKVNLVKSVELPITIDGANLIPTEFILSFVNPTTFRQKNEKTGKHETVALPEVSRILKSLSKTTYQLQGIYISLEELETIIDKINILATQVFPVQAKVKKTYNTEKWFIGDVHLYCGHLTERERKVVGLLFQWGKMTGIGYNKGAGFGRVKMKRRLA